MNIVVSDAHQYTVEQSEDPQVKSDEEIIIIYYICIILLWYPLLKLTTLHLPAKMLVIVLNRSQRGNSCLKNLKFHPESADPKEKVDCTWKKEQTKSMRQVKWNSLTMKRK